VECELRCAPASTCCVFAGKVIRRYLMAFSRSWWPQQYGSCIISTCSFNIWSSYCSRAWCCMVVKY
jgi:hypothetical protein